MQTEVSCICTLPVEISFKSWPWTEGKWVPYRIHRKYQKKMYYLDGHISLACIPSICILHQIPVFLPVFEERSHIAGGGN